MRHFPIDNLAVCDLSATLFVAVGSYFYPKTCNIWTAKMLQRAELPILLPLSTTAGGVLQQVKSHGRVLGESSPIALIHSLGWGKSNGSSP